MEGKASDYPEELRMGEKGRVNVGIVNGEHERVNYRVKIGINELCVQKVGSIPLDHKEKLGNEEVFVPQVTGIIRR